MSGYSPLTVMEVCRVVRLLVSEVVHTGFTVADTRAVTAAVRVEMPGKIRHRTQGLQRLRRKKTLLLPMLTVVEEVDELELLTTLVLEEMEVETYPVKVEQVITAFTLLAPRVSRDCCLLLLLVEASMTRPT